MNFGVTTCEGTDDAREAAERAIASYSTYLMFVASRLRGEFPLPQEAASDLVQRTFVVAITKIRNGEAEFTGRSEQELRAWLGKILEKRLLGREAALCRVEADPRRLAAPGPRFRPAGEAILNEEARGIRQALARISADDRELIAWREDDPFVRGDRPPSRVLRLLCQPVLPRRPGAVRGRVSR